MRYFLLREMVFGQDASFSDEAFVDRYNSDLANDLGNTVSRLVTLSRRAFDGCTPPVPCDSNPLIEAASTAVSDYRQAMDRFAFHRAIEALQRLLAETNQYIVAREPWKLIKSEGGSDRVSRILWNGLEAVRIVATALTPVMPTVSGRVLDAIAAGDGERDLEAMAWGLLENGRELPEPSPLFPRVDKAKFLAEIAAEEPAASEPEPEEPRISIDDFLNVELRIAAILEAEPVPKSDKLLKLRVDLGSEQRTLVAGIAQQYSAEDLVGRQVIVVANLEPAKLMGVESQGMVLAANEGGKPILLSPDQEVALGTRVR